MKSLSSLLKHKKESDQTAEKYNQVYSLAGLPVIKKENKRNIVFKANLDKLPAIGKDRKLGGSYTLGRYELEKGLYDSYAHFTIQLTDEDHLYFLYGTVYTEKTKWQNDYYDKESLSVLAGLYAAKGENPAHLCDMPQEKILELEYLLKKELCES